MFGLIFFSLLASYGIYSVVVDDTSDDDNDNDNDERVELEGDDTSDGEDTVDDGEDTVDGGDSGSDSSGQEVEGTDDSDILYGSEEEDVISGGEGDDSIEGYAGADSLSGGKGWDSIFGGNWQDTLDGGLGGDQLYGGRSEDLLFGAGGTDSLYGNEQSDTLIGGAGADTLDGGDGVDFLIDTKGDNFFAGGEGSDVIIAAGNGNQAEAYEYLAEGNQVGLRTFYSWIGDQDTSGADEVHGDAGSDTMFIGSGDTATGGQGADMFSVSRDFLFDGDEPVVVTDFNPGVDVIDYTVMSSSGANLSIAYGDGYAELLDGELVVMRLEGVDESFTLDDVIVNGFFVAKEGVEYYDTEYQSFGSPYDDLFVGTDDLDMFYGSEGNDTLYGLGGNDTLFGWHGEDFILGGDGDDSLDGGNGNDEVVGGAGNDAIFGYKDDDLLNGTSADLEYATFEVDENGTFLDVPMNDDTISTEGFDLIKGGPGKDILIAGGGDTIDGREGSDALVLVETADSDDLITIRAYDPAEDFLLIKYEGNTPPTITTQLDEDGQGTMIYLDGVAFAQINQSLPAGFSLVNAIGLERFGA